MLYQGSFGLNNAGLPRETSFRLAKKRCKIHSEFKRIRGDVTVDVIKLMVGAVELTAAVVQVRQVVIEIFTRFCLSCQGLVLTNQKS
jgi:hypothetical protein